MRFWPWSGNPCSEFGEDAVILVNGNGDCINLEVIFLLVSDKIAGVEGGCSRHMHERIFCRINRE